MFTRNAFFLALAGLVAAQTPTPGALETPTVPHNGTVVIVTKVYTAYTTVCPGPTQFEFNGHQYSVSEATTLTITDCPCTVEETSGPAVPTAQSGWGSGGKTVPSGGESGGERPSEQPYVEGGSSSAEGGQGGASTPVAIASGANAFQVSLGLAAALTFLAL